VLASAGVAIASPFFPSAAVASPVNGCAAVGVRLSAVYHYPGFDVNPERRYCAYVAQGRGTYQGGGNWWIYINGSLAASGGSTPRSAPLPTRNGDRVELFAGVVERAQGCVQLARSPACFPTHAFSVRAQAPAGFISARDD
jgi:hypothetical protein